MTDPDDLLRDAGARLRATAPSPDDTERALASLDVAPLDDRPTSRPTRWWLAVPAIATAAAAVIALVVVNRPDEGAVTPGSPAPTATSVATLTPTPETTNPTSVAPSVPDPLSTTTDPLLPESTPTAEVARTWQASVSDEGYDGDGGACVTITLNDTDEVAATGCIPGEMRRAERPAFLVAPERFGEPLVAVRLSLAEPTAAALRAANDFSIDCLANVEPAAREVVDLAACVQNDALVRRLARSPDGDERWTSTRQPDGALTPVEFTMTGDPTPGLVVLVGEPDAADPAHCVVVAQPAQPRDTEAGPGWATEACAEATEPWTFLVGPVPLFVVDVVGDAIDIAPIPLVEEPVGALVADASLLSNGCVGSLSEVWLGQGALVGARCAGDTAVIQVASTRWLPGPSEGRLTILRWSAPEQLWARGITDDELPCVEYAAACAALGATDDLGDVVLPIPPADILLDTFPSLAGEDTLEPTDATGQYTGVSVVADVGALADAIGARWFELGEEVSVHTVTGTRAPLVVQVTRIPDDALGAATLAVWYSPVDGRIQLDAVIEVLTCSRGVTDVDGERLCV